MEPSDELPETKEEYIGKAAIDGETAGPVQSPITQKAFDRRRPVFSPFGRVEDINTDEVKVADIRRHFFGLFIVYLLTVFTVLLSVGLLGYLLPGLIGDNAGTQALTAMLSLSSIVLGLIFAVLATKIYNSNQLIVTDINITQVYQPGLFSRKVSELTMENVEDVTANQNGIFPTLFNYGILTIETAGEQNNFIFKYCPNPNAYAKVIQDARNAYQKKHMKQ